MPLFVRVGMYIHEEYTLEQAICQGPILARILGLGRALLLFGVVEDQVVDSAKAAAVGFAHGRAFGQGTPPGKQKADAQN
jgi:hypothetical protein